MNPTFQLIACSGSGAASIIAENSFTSYALASAFVILLMILLRLTRDHPLARSLVLFPMVLLGLHPAWTISAVNGDCGEMRLLASVVIFVAMLILTGIVCLMIRRRGPATD